MMFSWMSHLAGAQAGAPFLVKPVKTLRGASCAIKICHRVKCQHGHDSILTGLPHAELSVDYCTDWLRRMVLILLKPSHNPAVHHPRCGFETTNRIQLLVFILLLHKQGLRVWSADRMYANTLKWSSFFASLAGCCRTRQPLIGHLLHLALSSLS